ncbi:RNA methyltransferase [Spirulina subsalsa FACHB-351]|uniref:RNA methyltransferase n=1 Tax=Spirulina subsalsa FACHB-351 TaxID=234711 RepID=A0ABT3L648_9CYAN|nr:THUMP domain-containing protein [Spirulina subsalsa]MCW6036917.1 RNA methyltransferase [Spirulina subsalsa FACHB-351]
MTQYFATVARGLEEIAAQELKDLGAQEVQPDFTGVYFRGNQELLYRVNLWSRLLFRVFVPVKNFPCRNGDQLYREIQKIDWRDYLTPDQTLSVHCTGTNAQLNHTHFTALQVKNAIVDQQRDQTGRRSSVDSQEADLMLNLHIHRDRAILSLDSSGSSLHRRGYRPAMGAAPLKETLASALLRLAQWTPETPLYDPLCGSGTILLEAGLQSLNIAPGLVRGEFAFERWSDFNPDLWQKLRQEALEQQRDKFPAPLWGSDRNAEIIQQARTNAQYCGLGDSIQFQVQDIEDIYPPTEPGILICNPPYGKRLGEVEELGSFYKLLGDLFKQRFTGWTAYILSGNKELTKKVGLKASRRFPVYNGSLPCTFLKYDLY